MGIYEPLFDVFFARSVEENYKNQQMWCEQLNLIGGICYIKLREETEEEGNLRSGHIQNSVPGIKGDKDLHCLSTKHTTASITITGKLGCAVSQRIDTGFPPRRPGFAYGQHVVFVVDKAALGQVFSEYFGFPCQSFHRFLHYHNHPGLTQ
jgi:hypothetical protein